jgi:Asp-tRNA(Asn)/Glu-tRNA(Gln) amidotransferase C subunit
MLSSSVSRACSSIASSRSILPLGSALRVSGPRLKNAGSNCSKTFHWQHASALNTFRFPAVSRMGLSVPRSSLIGHIRAFDGPSWSLHSLFAAPPRDLTDAEIEHLLSLAQLRVPSSDIGPLKIYMQSFLSFLETVKASDAGGCSPMHALPCAVTTASVDAPDVACDDATLDAVLCNASWQQESMFAVPKAIDE